MDNNTNSLATTKNGYVNTISCSHQSIYGKLFIINTKAQQIIKQLCAYKGVEIIGGAYSYVSYYTAKDKCIKFYGIFKMKERIYDIR